MLELPYGSVLGHSYQDSMKTEQRLLHHFPPPPCQNPHPKVTVSFDSQRQEDLNILDATSRWFLRLEFERNSIRPSMFEFAANWRCGVPEYLINRFAGSIKQGGDENRVGITTNCDTPTRRGRILQLESWLLPPPSQTLQALSWV